MNIIKTIGRRRLLRVGYIKYKDGKDGNKVKNFVSVDLDEYIEKLIEVPDEKIIDFKFGKNTLSFDDKK